MSEKIRVEHRFASMLLEEAEPSAMQRWEDCTSGHRFMSFPGKQLVVYSLMCGLPTVKDTLQCGNLSASLSSGVTSLWLRECGTVVEVSHTPREIAPSCFLWHPKFSQFEFSEHKGEPTLRFSMLYRQPKNPMTKQDGVLYLLERAAFDDFNF